jgi:hypothetical protein
MAGPVILSLFVFNIIINIIYSLPPFSISHIAELVPFFLPIGYVVVPYITGTFLSPIPLSQIDIYFLGALYLLFLSRISLKDFRDRKGDSMNGKVTFLLKYGKTKTWILSLTSLILGGTLLLLANFSSLWLLFGLSIFLKSAIFLEFKLMHEKRTIFELLTISFMSRFTNGMRFALLSVLIIRTYHAEIQIQIMLFYGLLAIYLFYFVEFIRKPESFSFSYKNFSHMYAKSKSG